MLAAVALSLVRNDNIDYPTIGEHLFSPLILNGLLVTFQLSIISMLIGIAIGVIVAVAGMSSNLVLQAFRNLSSRMRQRFVRRSV